MKLSYSIQVWRLSALNTCPSWQWPADSRLGISEADPICSSRRVLGGHWQGSPWGGADVACILALSGLLYSCQLVIKRPWSCGVNRNGDVACFTYVADRRLWEKYAWEKFRMRSRSDFGVTFWSVPSIHTWNLRNPDLSTLYCKPRMPSAVAAFLQKAYVDCSSTSSGTDGGLLTWLVVPSAKAIWAADSLWSS